jgi:transketolase N-terminal domain/subunit
METRLIELLHAHKLGHLGSCLTMLPILDHVYSVKKPNDIVVLSAGHAGAALYTVLEKYEGRDAEKLLEKHGVHPNRDLENGIYVSTGSLGSGILVAVGYAVADRNRDVYVLLTDGECAEGSVWEALAFAYKNNLTNLKVHVNVNGYSAYDKVNRLYLWLRLKAFYWRTKVWFTSSPSLPCLEGLKAHYHVINDEDKDMLTRMINEEAVCPDAPYGNGPECSTLLNNWRSWLRNFGQDS